MVEKTFGEQIVEELNELCDILERGEEPGCYYRIDVVKKPDDDIANCSN